jgi:hypothetical protein
MGRIDSTCHRSAMSQPRPLRAELINREANSGPGVFPVRVRSASSAIASSAFAELRTQKAVERESIIQNAHQSYQRHESKMETTSSIKWEVHCLRTDASRYGGPCEYRREPCTKPAVVRIEVLNKRSMPSWDGEYCYEHAGQLVEKANAAGVRIIDDQAAWGADD